MRLRLLEPSRSRTDTNRFPRNRTGPSRPPMTPEQRARQQIDLLLQQCGWIVQDRSQTNLAAGAGVAIREALLKTGEADYLLFAGGKAIATVEANLKGIR
jgi:type I restriction enzyme R subunit